MFSLRTLCLAACLGLLAQPDALWARQTPCDNKKSYDDAKAIQDKADKALEAFLKKSKRPPGRILGGMAGLQAELARTRGDTTTNNQLLRDAEQALKDAQKDSTDFAGAADKGKRLGDLPQLIKTHQEAIAKVKKNLDAKKTTVDEIDKAKTANTTTETAIKKLMPGIDLGSNLTDLDASKTQVDDDVAQFEKAYQAAKAPDPTWWQRVTGNVTGGKAINAGDAPPPAPTTKLSCPDVEAVKQRMSIKYRSRDEQFTLYLNVDQNAAGAAQLRTEYLKKIEEFEKGIQGDLAPLRTAVQNCQQDVKAAVQGLGTKRTALEQLDPDGSIKTMQEELKKLEADDALQKELDRLKAAANVVNGQVSTARTGVTSAKTAKTTADESVQEIELNMDAQRGDDTVSKVDAPYLADSSRMDAEAKAAQQDLDSANAFLTNLNQVKTELANYKKVKKPWDDRNTAWKAKKDAWEKGGKDPATRSALQAEYTKLQADKVPVDEAKAKLVKLLKEKKWNKAVICDRKKVWHDALSGRTKSLDEFKCFPKAATLIKSMEAPTKSLASARPLPRAPAPGLFQLAGWTSAPRRVHRHAGLPRSRPALLEALNCTIEDFQTEQDIDALDEETPVDSLETPSEEPTDSVPGDVGKNSGAVQVARYFVFLLTNASNGLYVGDEDGLKHATRCGFVGGGIGCKPTDLISYRKLKGPFPTQAEAQLALCQSITETRYFPIGVGLKGRWEGGNTWYGLWDASVNGCPKQ